MELYNLSYIKEISGGDVDFVDDMIQTFLETAPQTIQRLWVLYNENNWQSLGYDAHKFVPNTIFMGITEVDQYLDEIYAITQSNNIDKTKIEQNLRFIEEKCNKAIQEIKNDFNK
jgi:hypothetical protein